MNQIQGQVQDEATTLGGAVRMHQTIDAFFVDDYRSLGFAVLRGALSEPEVSELNAEAVDLARQVAGGPATEGLAGAGRGDDALQAVHCIHHPHKASPVMRAAMAHPSLVDALTAVIGPNVKAMQSMYFVKAMGKPGQAWHQDEHFIPTRDRSLTAAWIALDDATTENGCLWVLPGSHRRGVLYPDRKVDDVRFDCNTEAYGYPYAEGDAVPVEVPAGAALIFNGYLLHRSLPNTGRHGFRRALVNHYMSAESLLPWKEAEGEHFGELDFRDVVLVAGEDPYAYKGVREMLRPHARSEREGGCDR
jgi:chlorinating enzyme